MPTLNTRSDDLAVAFHAAIHQWAEANDDLDPQDLRDALCFALGATVLGIASRAVDADGASVEPLEGVQRFLSHIGEAALTLIHYRV